MRKATHHSHFFVKNIDSFDQKYAIDVFNLFMKSDSNVDEVLPNSSRDTVLINLLKKEETEFGKKILDIFLEYKPNPKLKNKKSQTCLHYAVHWDSKYVNYFLSNGISANVKDIKGASPLLYAIKPKNIEILVNHGADINTVDQYKHNIISISYVRSHNTKYKDYPVKEIILISLKLGIKYNNYAETIFKGKKVFLSSESIYREYKSDIYFYEKFLSIVGVEKTLDCLGAESLDLLKILLKYMSGINDVINSRSGTLLHLYCHYLPFLSFLLENGANPNMRDKDLRTHIMMAEKYECVDILLKNDADPYLVDKDGNGVFSFNPKIGKLNAVIDNGYNPMKMSVKENDSILTHFYGDIEALKILLGYGADINSKSNGNTILYLSCYWEGKMDLIRFIVENGADLNAKNSEGDTVLHFLCKTTGKLDLFNFIIENGADLNIQNNNLETPLISMVRCQYNTRKYFNKSKIIKLLEKGANPNIKDSLGNTFLHHYILNTFIRDRYIIRKLLSYGADISILNNQNKSPLDYVNDINLKEYIIEHSIRNQLWPDDAPEQNVFQWIEVQTLNDIFDLYNFNNSKYSEIEENYNQDNVIRHYYDSYSSTTESNLRDDYVNYSDTDNDASDIFFT